MKTRLPALFVTLALSATSLPAAKIAFVSYHINENAPAAPAAGVGFTNAPDKGYTALLTANGHTVTRFLRTPDLQNLPDLIAALNTNDLVIVSRSAPSGDFDSLPETAAWNTSITVPLISLGGYIDRANRLGFHTGDTIPDANSTLTRLRVTFSIHPIFAGISFNSTNLMVNPYTRRMTHTNSTTGVTTLQLGVSVVTSPVIAGGSVLATIGTPGDAAFGGAVIAEFPAGTTTQRGDVLAAKRLVFLTGSREATPVPGEGSGIYDLQADGATMFLNAVTYMTTSQPPLPPQATSPLVGATNLVEGDTWTFDAGVFGDTPRTYQWYKNGLPLATGTDVTLVFPSLTLADAGEYQLFVTNATGWATSTLARLEFAVFPPDSIASGLISYWPLNEVQGNKTFDLVSTFDMTLVNMGASNVVAGKWGNAFQFNGTNALLERINNPNDDLPIYKHPNLSVSLWVNASAQTDRRVFSEGSLTDGDPLFNLGTHNTGADGTVDIYIRNDTGGTVGDHRHSLYTAYDGANWHNIVYVQRDIGGGQMKAQLWVDGFLDTVVITPVRPLTARATAIGAVRRAAASAWFNGMIDEVAVWNRALSSNEVQILQVTAITNPPVRPQPLVISSAKADLAAVVTGGSTTLRWDVSRDVTQVTLNGVDVTANTSFGLGSLTITQSVATNYVLTVTRGVNSISATTSVAVVEGVAPGWNVLDTFDQALPGSLFASGYWNDTSGNGGQVVTVNGNRALRATSAGISFLNLRNLSVQETQTRSLFFRVIPGEANATVATNIVGLTDKSQRSFGDADDNIGSVLYVTPFTNDVVGITTNGWYLGARNGPGTLPDYIGTQPQPQTALEAGVVYNVWVDITNAPLVDLASDMFTVYIQKEGGAPRTVLFQDYLSDRDLFLVDPVLGGITPVLDKLVVMCNSATFSSVFDDFYLSTTGYNATVPKAYSFALPPGPLSVSWVGSQIQISWSNGTLQSSPNANGPYVDVPGNPTSPLLVSPTGERTFYRSRQ